MSGIVLLLRSKNLVSLYLRMTGKIRSNYFSERFRRVYAMDLLLAVLLNPDNAPLSASSNFLRSSSALSLAYSSAFLRYYSFNLSSSYFCLRSSSICSYVFGGGTYSTYSDMFKLYYLRLLIIIRNKHMINHQEKESQINLHLSISISSKDVFILDINQFRLRFYS